MIKPYTENAQKLAKILTFVLLGALVLLVAGCGEVDDDDGTVTNTVLLPLDDTIPLDLYCADVGIHNETCILDDPDNPYANSPITEESKFELWGDSPSSTASFYLWGTALARGIGAPGENQFYVAYYLHQLWAASSSELTRLQALRAYRSYLDNYFDSTTFFEIPLDSDIFFPFSLNQFTGELLFDPTNGGNVYTGPGLFNINPVQNAEMAEVEVGEWGYYYDQVTKIFTPF